MGDLDSIKDAVDRVSDVIDNAIKSNDYTDLSRQIGGLMRSATDTVAHTASSFAKGVSEAAKQGESMRDRPVRGRTPSQVRREEAERRSAERRNREAYEAQYFAKPGDTTGGKILQVIGAAGSVVFGALTVTLGVVAAAAHGIFLGAAAGPLAVVTAVITAVSFCGIIFGGRAVKKTEHFNKYRSILLRKLYADVDDIAKESGVPRKKVVSELKEFSSKGMIKQGHFDDKETCFIASDELYSQYRETAQHAAELRQAEEQQRMQSEAREAAYSPEVKELLEKGNEYIRMIHEANDRIPGEEVTDKLNRMETITRRIFEEVRKRPELAGSLNLFMNYYLPTTTKLVKAYEEMDQQPVEGDNIKNAKREIENSLDTISDAFEKLLDSFFKEQAMDVSSDINVMKMMMQQDGLTEDEMTAAKRRADAAAQAQTASAPAAAAQAQTASASAAQAQTQSLE